MPAYVKDSKIVAAVAKSPVATAVVNVACTDVFPKESKLTIGLLKQNIYKLCPPFSSMES